MMRRVLSLVSSGLPAVASRTATTRPCPATTVAQGSAWLGAGAPFGRPSAPSATQPLGSANGRGPVRAARYGASTVVGHQHIHATAEGFRQPLRAPPLPQPEDTREVAGGAWARTSRALTGAAAAATAASSAMAAAAQGGPSPTGVVAPAGGGAAAAAERLRHRRSSRDGLRIGVVSFAAMTVGCGVYHVLHPELVYHGVVRSPAVKEKTRVTPTSSRAAARAQLMVATAPEEDADVFTGCPSPSL